MNNYITNKLEVTYLFKTFFSYNELCCKCGCNKLKLHNKTALKLLQFRVLYNKPFSPRSVYRCENHEDYSSNHNGWAVDIPCYNKIQLYDIVENLIKIEIKRIIYNKKLNYVHWDINPEYDFTNNKKILDIY